MQQSWIIEAFPSIAAKFDCNFKMVAGDPYSLHWECKIKHVYDSASALFDDELVSLLCFIVVSELIYYLF